MEENTLKSRGHILDSFNIYYIASILPHTRNINETEKV